MKKLLFIIAAVFVSSLAVGQTNEENYVKSTSYTEPVEDQAGIDALTVDQKPESIMYYDGLGRANQSVAPRAGGNKETIYTHFEYDFLGRRIKEFLPVPSDSELLVNEHLDVYENSVNQSETLLDKTNIYYIAKHPADINGGFPNPFSEKLFEASPINRVLKQGAPGIDWAIDDGHTIKFDYQINTLDLNNTDQDNVIQYTVIFPTGNTEEPELYFNGYFNSDELYKSVTKDENWEYNPNTLSRNRTTEEFKNKKGQVILKRSYYDEIVHDTYYVYDKFGNLTYVLSPNGSENLLYENTYKSYTQYVDYTAFIETDKKGDPISNGSGGVTIELDETNGTFKVGINLQYDEDVELINGPIALLAGYTPNMVVGTITHPTASYVVSVQDGFLYISGSGLIHNDIIESFTVNLPAFSVDTNVLEDFCYEYHYDSRNRLVEKKIPGKGWEYIVYDKLDRPVLTQDALLRESDLWLATKYDALSRPVYTGLFWKTGYQYSRTEIQTAVNLNTDLNEVRIPAPNVNHAPPQPDNSMLYYSSASFPHIKTLLTVTYYDDYNFDLNGLSAPTSSYGIVPTSLTKTLVTGSKSRVIDTDHWITSVSYYNDKARPIYIGSVNDYLVTTDILESELDFVGKVTETTSTHTKGGNSPIITIDKFTYDHASRLLTQSQSIDSSLFELIVNNSYDELGQLENKKVGGIVAALPENSVGLQTIDYKYNVRGWLKEINDVDALGTDLFGFKINYNTTELFGGQELFNGNISDILWNTLSVDPTTSESGIKRAYTFQYDDLNRIYSAVYFKTSGEDHSGYFNLQGVKYDRNGNIATLNRSGLNDVTNTYMPYMDVLSYVYHGNQLVNIKETGHHFFGFRDGNNIQSVDYDYDVNGNMTIDNNKGIFNISYNHLNLPTAVNVSNGSVSGVINYVYDATGVKLSKQVTDNGNITTTSYAGNYIYETIGGTETLKFFNHSEGYVQPDGSGGYEYIYQYKDHLGNIRLSYSDTDGNGTIVASSDPNTNEIIEENNYYPFGLKHKGYNNFINGTENNFKTFQGQELTENLGLNVLEFKYRTHDPAIGRFWQVDPLAEGFAYNGVYNFAENRVIEGLEIEGLETFSIHGTFSNPSFMTSTSREQISNVFDNNKSYSPRWSGGNTHKARVEAASKIAEFVASKFDPSESSITLVGHSHGGNVAIMAANILAENEQLGDVVINLVTINTPVRSDYQLDEDSGVTHYNIYNKGDVVQRAGANDSDGKSIGVAGRIFKNAINISYEDQFSTFDSSGCGISNHCGTATSNVNQWLPSLNRQVNQVERNRNNLNEILNSWKIIIGSAGSADDQPIIPKGGY